jgi:hypothetical protein
MDILGITTHGHYPTHEDITKHPGVRETTWGYYPLVYTPIQLEFTKPPGVITPIKLPGVITLWVIPLTTWGYYPNQWVCYP